MSTILTLVFSALGWSRYTDWALKLLPLITQYGPVVIKFLETASATWASFKSQYPTFGAAIENLAQKWFPKLALDQAVMVTLKGIFAPHKMTPAEEKIWMDRGTTYNPDLSDFPQGPA